MVVLAGCSSSFLGPDPPETPEVLFEAFWESYDRYYAHFELKGIDWDATYARHRPKITEQTTEDELFEIFSEMIQELEDGHVYLVAGDRRAFSDRHLRGGRRNFDSQAIQQNYLRESADEAGEGNMLYGSVGENIGYLRLSTLSGGHGTGSRLGGWVEDIDFVLEQFSEKDGLVLDLRNNGGGRAYNTKFLASRFATEKIPFVVTRSRNGPNHDDFSAPKTWYITPFDGPIFHRPVVILTNRYSFSAAEWLTLALREFDHVTHMGTHTGGGLAMFLPRELPNGWTHTVSVQDTRSPDGRSFERVGVAPHHFLEIEEEDELDGRDTILEEAIKFLNSQAR